MTQVFVTDSHTRNFRFKYSVLLSLHYSATVATDHIFVYHWTKGDEGTEQI
jgi:hypothetical protein